MTYRILFTLTLLLLAGCNSGNVGLTGKVTFSDDGSPLPVGSVCFTTDTYFARGDLKPDGTFVVGSLKSNDGLLPGTYRVHILGAEKEIGPETYESLIDKKFASGATSGITLNVTASTKHFEIVVDRYQKK